MTGIFDLLPPMIAEVVAPLIGYSSPMQRTGQAAALHPPSAFDVLIRSLTLIALMLVCGGFAFSPLVLGSQSAQPLRSASAVLRRRVLWAGLIGAAALFALAFVARADQAPPSAVGTDAIGSTSATGALASRSSLVFALRIALLIVLAAMLSRSRHESPWVLLPCAALVLTQSLLSRSASEPEWVLPTLADWMHTLGAAIWLGGVAMLALITPLALAEQSFRELGAAIHRFSPLATACVLVVALTGIMQSASFVGSFDALVGTAYGRTLLVKLALSGVLIGFGAFHQHVISPRLNAWRASAIGLAQTARRFRVSILIEVGVSVLLLCAAAAMTALPAARDFV